MLLFFKRPVLIVILSIAGFVLGFIFLLKSCLSKYDERFIKTPALAFEKNGKTVIFSVVQFDKTTSYSQKGGFVNKTVSSQYFVQSNDGVTADLLNKKKVKNHREIKNFPVEIMGAAGNTAWVFMGEPMAFDPFTLDKIADVSLLEEKNKQLAGKFPAERQFYTFNKNDNNIYFTAKDGTKWQLNTQSLLVSPSSYQKNESPFKNKMSLLEQELKDIQTQLDSLYQQKSIGPSRDYSAKKITYAQYQQLNQAYYKERDVLYKMKDSVSKIKNDLDRDKRKLEETERNIENLQGSAHSFSQIKSNFDTLSPQWFGLYSDEEIEKLSDRVSNHAVYDETIRRKIWAGTYAISKYDEPLLDKASVTNKNGTDFLAGGFLLDKETARPVHVPGDHSFLIVHKDEVGNDGKIVLTNTDAEGKIIWTYNTQLSQWNDWIIKGEMLFVFGKDNKNLSSDQTNILLCINLKKGGATKYDYFKEKKLE